MTPTVSNERKWRLGADLLASIARSPYVVAAIFAAGLFLRLYAARHAHFDHDEAQSWRQVMRIFDAGEWPLVGHSVSGTEAFTPGPLFFYVMAIPQMFSRDPLAGSYFMAALNLFGLWLVFRAVRAGWSDEAAAVFLLLAVAAPWLVVFSDRIWPSNLALFPGALVVYALVRMCMRERSRVAALLGAVLVVGPQIHLSATLLFMLSILTLVVVRPRIRWRWLAGGAALGALAYVPYLVHELDTGFSNTRALANVAFGEQLSFGRLWQLFLYFFGLSTTDLSGISCRGDWAPLAPLVAWMGGGPDVQPFRYSPEPAAFVELFSRATWLTAALGAAVAAGRWAASPRRWRSLRAQPFAVLFLAGVIAVAGAYLLSKRAGFPHFDNMLWPIAFIPATALFVWLARLPFGALVTAAYLAGAAAAGVLALVAFYRADDELSIPTQQAVVAYIRASTDGGKRPFQLRFGWPGGNHATYAQLAFTHQRGQWLADKSAPHVFTVTPKRVRAPGAGAFDAGPLFVEQHIVEAAPSRP